MPIGRITCSTGSEAAAPATRQGLLDGLQKEVGVLEIGEQAEVGDDADHQEQARLRSDADRSMARAAA